MLIVEIVVTVLDFKQKSNSTKDNNNAQEIKINIG